MPGSVEILPHKIEFFSEGESELLSSRESQKTFFRVESSHPAMTSAFHSEPEALRRFQDLARVSERGVEATTPVRSFFVEPSRFGSPLDKIRQAIQGWLRSAQRGFEELYIRWKSGVPGPWVMGLAFLWGKDQPRLNAGAAFAEFGKHYDRIYQKLEEVFGSLPEAQAEDYLTALGEIETRRRFWETQAEQVETLSGEERDRLQQDIGIGLGLLREKLLRVGAEIYQEPLAPERRSRWGIRYRAEREKSGPDEPNTEPKLSPQQVPALVNRDVGYGRSLSLREHQVAALHALRGRIRLLQSFLEGNTPPPPEALEGTVVMPVGGGKTRTMVAGFAAALELGWMDPKAGDKVIILNHTDQIHGQNVEVAGLLENYFKRQVGRTLKISEYKAEKKDLSGDVIVVSLPSISEDGKRAKFQEELHKALGANGKVAMVAVDEVHHLGLGKGKTRETWAQAIQAIRDISPNLFQVGFTATPTGKEPGRLFSVREHVLMEARVTPRTYLVRVDGIDLSQLKVTTSGEFEGRGLQSTLLGHPERNQRIYEALNQHGMRSEIKSPSDKPKLEPTLGFGQDLKHAQAMAEDYVGYFAKASGDLGGRNLAVLGKNRGKITSAEFNKAIQDYRAGKVDGIVALVSGITGGQRDPVLQAVERGEIEAVFTVDALVEGADLYMFSHQIGGRPTFSRFKKGQERGRINRRGPDEVSGDGHLLKDPPKILFDVVDRYQGEQPLIRYGDILGIGGHTQLKNGEMMDALSGKPVTQVDRTGKDIAPNPTIPPLPPKTPPPQTETTATDTTPLVKLLEEILAERYRGDLESLALDLGETEDFVAGLLEGRGWENSRWFLKRLATLLYQERESFVTLYNESRGQYDAGVSAEDYALLQGAMALYARWENREPDVAGFQWGTGAESFKFTPFTLMHLRNKTLSDGIWRELWQGLALYLEAKSVEVGFAENAVAQAKQEVFWEHFFKRSNWEQSANDPQAALLSEVRRVVARQFGGILPARPGLGLPGQHEDSPLSRWLRGEGVEYSSRNPAQTWYVHLRTLLVKTGMEQSKAKSLIEAAIFSERGWESTASDPQAALLLEARRAVARMFGGILPFKPSLGLPLQGENSPLRNWLRGEGVEHSNRISPQAWYAQVRTLLVKTGMEESKVEPLIEAAIFGERGWDSTASNPQAALLLEARRMVARVFGGVLPKQSGLGLTQQSENSPLSRWLGGEGVEYSNRNSPRTWYAQVRTLLVNTGMEESKVEPLIEAAIFSEQGWERTASDPQAALLLEARRMVARVFGGVLPRQSGLGIPEQHESSALTRWLRGEGVEYWGRNIAQTWYAQLRTLFVKTGVEESKAESLIEAAIFSEQGWERTASDPQAALLLEVRRAVAKQFGGILPYSPGFDLLHQNESSPLRSWVRGEGVEYSRHIKAQTWYAQVRTLLVKTGMEESRAEALIEAAIFSEQGWERTASDPQEVLLLKARRVVARQFGGILPYNPGFGLPRQSEDSPLSCWLQGPNTTISENLLPQIRTLLIQAGGLEPAEVEMLLRNSALP